MITYSILGFIWINVLICRYITEKRRIPRDLLNVLIYCLYNITYKCTYLNIKKKNILISQSLTPLLNNLNIKLNTYGFINNNKNVIYICNHSSYLDPIIIKYLKPNIKTIAKDDIVGEFSVIKKFAKQILDNWGVIFYKRGNKNSGKVVRNVIKNSVLNGDSILIFPEGKTHAFEGLRDFYPGSFETAYEYNLVIQPITIKYLTDITWGMEKSYTRKHHIDIVDNVIECKRNNVNNVNITFHPLIYPDKFNNHNHLMNYVKYIMTEEWIKQHHYINITNKLFL